MIYSDIKAKVMDQLKFVFKDESEFDLTILDGILEELPDNINSDRETFANLTETYIKAAKSYKDSDLEHMEHMESWFWAGVSFWCWLDNRLTERWGILGITLKAFDKKSKSHV